ncbi:MAG TPA: hypothetical protein VJR89_34510, partial [Polyangiales bacterium]|nr:hypothetical protein [Polyangiales bacterium]
SYVLAPGVEVRPLDRTPAAKTKLDLNDGLTGPLIPLRTGYVAGHEVQYWDLGTAPTSAEPMWRFKRHDGTRVDHPPLVDSIPGDTAYSPIRILFDVFVTPRYAGERFPSLRALDDGVELGLLEDPVQTDQFTNCVVTIKDNQLEAGGDRPPHNPTPVFYRGREVNQFCVDELMGDDGMFMSKMGAPVFGNALLLRRENQMLSLDESLFKADLNGDGDMSDSNVVFDADVGDAGYTSLWKNLDVVVSDDYMFGALQSQDAMFDKKPWGLSPKDAMVVEVKDTTLIVNRPLRPVAP